MQLLQVLIFLIPCHFVFRVAVPHLFLDALVMLLELGFLIIQFQFLIRFVHILLVQ